MNCAESSSTQLVVLMDTDYSVPSEVDRVRARVLKMVDADGGLEELQTWERVFSVSNQEPSPPGAYALPATFAVLPADADIDREVVVELEALAVGTDRTLGSRRVRTKFVPGEARLLRMLIHRACEDVSCAEGESCGCPDATSCATPSCVDEWVSPDALEPIGDPGQLPPNSEFPGEGGAGGDGGTGGVGGTGGAGGADCEPPLELCDAECVNTDSDPRFCGDCAVACPSGFVCSSGGCVDPGDCRINEDGCTGFTYCDEATGDCLPGCAIDDQCPGDREVCDVDEHACVCEPDFERCDLDCVDTQTDPSFCGDCSTSCDVGEVCEMGGCLDPGDCRTNGTGCTGFTYCDDETGACLRGCERDDQCTGDNRVCDTVLHECVCDVGFHSCGGTCVSDLDVNSCGDSCTPCPQPPGSTATCEAGICGLICDDGLEQCGTACVDTQTDPRFCGGCATSCPAGDECIGGQCFDPGDCRTNGIGCVGFNYCDAATGDCLSGCDMDAQCTAPNEVCDLATHDCACDDGFHDCGGVCVSDADVASCGTSCTPCLQPPGSTATCEAGICGFECTDRFVLCGEACCPTSCPPGQVLFEGTCASFHVRVAGDQGKVGEYASLALDAAGNPHLACYAENAKNLFYSRLPAGGVWTEETAVSAGDVGEHASLAINAAGSVQAAFYDSAGKDLKFAIRGTSGTWTPVTIDSQGDVGQHASLAFAPNGVAHVAYYDEGNKDLRLATRQPNGTWSTELVDEEGDVGRYASLGFSPAGVAHIAYYDEGSKDLLLAIEQPGGAWSYEVVDSLLDVGMYASLGFDPNGVVFISYYDETNKNLKLARRPIPSIWLSETVDSQGDVGSHTSLAFDAAGTAHVSYFDETNLDLKHATRKPGQAWRLQRIDSTGIVGRFTSIAIDAQGHAHIGYYDETNTNLKYALVAAPL